MMTNTQTLGDKETVNDFIAGQKMITSAYNTFAGECANECLRNDFLNILKDEHCIQAELFTEASSRGWYQTKAAPTAEVNQVKTKFTTGS